MERNVTINYGNATKNWVVCCEGASPKMCNTWEEVLEYLKIL